MNALDARSELLRNALLAHVRRYFPGHAFERVPHATGRLQREAPWFEVLRIAPGEATSLWTYYTFGAALLNRHEHGGTEFFVQAEHPDGSLVELVAMVASYSTHARFDAGHTVPIGHPWLPGSAADNLLISTPYQFEPDFQFACVDEFHLRSLWLLPVTHTEARFRHTHDLEALESRFEAAGIEYWNPRRASVV